MQHDRSIEAQRARLLGKKSSSKPRSDKFVKKEIINMKYGLQKKTPPQKMDIKNFYISGGVFGAVLIITIFLVQPLLSFILSLVSFFVSLGVMNSYKPKKASTLPKVVNLNYVFEEYDSLIVGDIKDKMLSIKNHSQDLLAYELTVSHKHYIQSTLCKDLPDIFSHYSHLKNDNESKEKLITQLNIIEEKLVEIKGIVEPDYKQKLEIKARVVKEKANI